MLKIIDPIKLDKSIILISFLIILGSSNPVAIKYALNIGWTPMFLGGLRMGFIGLFVLFWLRIRKETILPENTQANFFLLVAALSKGFGVIFFYLALSKIPAYRCIMLSTFSPVVNLFLIHFLLQHEKIQKNHVTGILVSLIGILALLTLKQSNEGQGEMQFSIFYGDIFMLSSIVFHNVMVIFEKKALMFGANPRQLIISNSLVSTMVFFAFFFILQEKTDLIPIDPKTIGIFIYLISVTGVVLFNYRRWLVSKFDVSYINSFSHPGKAVSIIYAVFLLGESISPASMICFIFILAGTYIATLRTKKSDEGSFL